MGAFSELDAPLLDGAQAKAPHVTSTAKTTTLLALVLILFTDFALLTAVIPTVPDRLDKQGVSDFSISLLFASKAAVNHFSGFVGDCAGWGICATYR